jgi:transposase
LKSQIYTTETGFGIKKLALQKSQMEIPLTETLYKEVHSLYKSTKDKRTANYLNIILLKHKNYRQVEIADILNLDENTISTWVNKFETSSTLAEYLAVKYTSYIGKLSYTFLGKVDDFVQNTTYSDTKPIISSIKTRFGVSYSVSGITKLLARLGFTYKNKVALPSKLDVTKQLDFVTTYETIVADKANRPAIFFMDGVHPQHNTHTLKGWLRKGKTSYILTNTGRNRLNINGLYNPYTQETIVTYHTTINAQAVIATFEKLKMEHPDTPKLFTFSDNAKYYVSKLVKAYLAENPRIQLIHLPPYSPNLNLIERLWKYLRKTVIHPHYYEKFEQFSAAIQDFFDNIKDRKDHLATFIGCKFRLFNFT